MNTNLPLEELILTLLALAEVAPQLDGEARVALAEVGQELKRERNALAEGDEAGLVDLLLDAQMDIATELYANSHFQAARRAWGEELAVRVGLNVNKLNQSLINPDAQRSFGVVYLTKIVEDATQEPEKLAENEEQMGTLAKLLNRIWPRKKG